MKNEAVQAERGRWSGMIGALCAGVTAGAIVLGLLTVCFAAVISLGRLPSSAFSSFAQLAAFVGALVGGFLGARRAGGRGAVVGAVTGAALFAVLTASALIVSGKAPGGTTVTRLIAMPLCGAVGGILGVNLRRK